MQLNKEKIRQAMDLLKCLEKIEALKAIQFILDNPGQCQKQVSLETGIFQEQFTTMLRPLLKSKILLEKREGLFVFYKIDLDRLEEILKTAKKLIAYKPVHRHARATTN